MPPPIDPATREAIEADIRAGELSRNAIAKTHGVAQGTVSRIARKLEETGALDGTAFDRAKTESASRARAVDNAARRADLEAEFLRRALAELSECDSGMTVGQFGGKDNVWSERWFDRAPHNVRATLVRTAAQAAKAAADLAGAGREDPVERAVTLLERLAE